MPTPKQVPPGTLSQPIQPPLELTPESNQPLALAPEPGLEVAMLRARTDLQMQATELAYRAQKDARMAEFDTAFARAQSQFGPILRDKEVKVWSARTQKEYTFKFAPLPNILAATMPALTAEGFSVWQEVVVDRSPGAMGWAIVTHLEHASGARTNTMPVFVGDATSASFASACSYARRYGFTLLMNVTGDDDDDGNLGRGDHYEEQRHGHAGAARTGPRGKDPAPPPGGAPGRATPAGTRAAPAPKPERVVSYLESIDTVDPVEPPADEAEMEKAEGLIVDAAQELIEAAQDGRAHGIEQIWNEIRSNQYVAIMVWRRLKADAPDAFSTIKATLEKAEKAAKANQAPAKRGDRG